MKYKACIVFDDVTNTCTTEQWVDSVTMKLDPVYFPNLTETQVFTLLGAIALVFAIAWGWKFLSDSILNKR